MSTRTCKPERCTAEDALPMLIARWAVEHEDDVIYDEHVIVVRLPRVGVFVQLCRRRSACWIDTGHGVLQATVRQAAEALAAELQAA